MLNRDEAIDAMLEEFACDPQKAMNQQPTKRDGKTGEPLKSPATAFAPSDIAGNRYVEQRDQVRKKMCTERDGELISLDQILPGRAPFKNNDLAENLVDSLDKPLLRRLEDIEDAKLTTAKLPDAPWSDFYWPIYQGILGARYADPKSPTSQNWQERRKFTEARPLLQVVRDARQAEVDLLSPSEKYDLLLGQMTAPLTESMWSQGRSYFERSGSVETWMGICHGWAPAAFMLPRPTKLVTLPSADKRFTIRFFPADLKALGSLLWAAARTPTRFIGGRCNDKGPKLDANGRVLSDDCFDTNPGTWHLSVVNQIGVAKRSMIIDATFDYEVWNQPVVSYAYSYWNPITRKATKVLKDAVVTRSAHSSDPWKSYRSENAVSLVGVAMELTYLAETNPSHVETDSPAQDRTITVTYIYDLELDAKGQILGGEWYSNKHPDFLWTPPPSSTPTTLGDRRASGAWDPQLGLPDSWREAGLVAAQSGQPLEKIVTALFTLAK
jgi:hypothetical protein